MPRLVVPGLPHHIHITQRGNYRQQVFFSDEDRCFFLQRLELRASRHGLDILGWCLMSNHFHLIAAPRAPASPALTLRPLLSEYAMRMNSVHNQLRGHLWQSRFYSCALEERRLCKALRYAELNPVWACVASRAEQYAWSSARYHAGLEEPPNFLQMSPWNEYFTPQEWMEALYGSGTSSDLQELRRSTCTGRPWGDDEFLRGLEPKAGRKLQPNPVGRPPRGRSSGAGLERASRGLERQMSFVLD